MAHDVDRADPLVGRVVADGNRRAVPVGVDVVEADLHRPAAAVAVVTVAAEPVPQHVPLVLRRPHDVDAAGLLRGGTAGAPGVGGLGEDAAGGVVGAGQARASRVAQRVAAARVGSGDGQRVRAVPLAVAGACPDVVVAVEHHSGGRVHVDVQMAGGLRGAAGEHRLPGQLVAAVLDAHHEAVRVDLVHRGERAACGGLGGCGRDRRCGRDVDPCRVGGPGGLHPALAVGQDHRVPADHRQATVGAFVGDRVEAVDPGRHLTPFVALARPVHQRVEAAGGGAVGRRHRQRQRPWGDGRGGGRGGRRAAGGDHHPGEDGQGCPGRHRSAFHGGSLTRGMPRPRSRPPDGRTIGPCR